MITPLFCFRMIGSTWRMCPQRPEKVCLKQCVDRGILPFFDRRMIAVAGIVDQSVDRVEVRTDPLYGRFDHLRGRDVQRDGHQLFSQATGTAGHHPDLH